MNQPKIQQQGGIYHLTWDEGIEAQVAKVREHRDGRITAELSVTTSLPGYKPYLLGRSLFNLLAIRSRVDMAKNLKERCPEIEWEEALEQLCHIVLEDFHRGEPVTEIWTTDDIKPPEYLLYP
ncbi:MAG: hypothetical protein GH152_00570, partial [Dehalococcoidia bacterium]|nr:hypothetical protein [Dehalococcoidia bacterium]